jgi:hypothetical protein
VDDKDAIHVRSRDVADALALAPDFRVDPDEPRTLTALLQEDRVVVSLWRRRKVRVELEEPLAEVRGSELTVPYRLVNSKGVIGVGRLVVSAPGNLPTRGRIRRLAQAAGTGEVVVVVPITARHVLATRFEGCLEASRKVYEVAVGGAES